MARDARTEGVDLVTAATSAQLAQDAAVWAGRLASATAALLGNADVAAVRLCWEQARAANRHAANAAECWQHLKDERGCINA